MPARTRRENKALKAAVASSPPGEATDGNVRRARTPRGAPLAGEENALKGEAHGRSGATRAGRIGGGRREGGSQTSDVARGGGGIRRLSSGSAGPGLCRRARKLRRGSITGRVAHPATEWRCDAVVRGCCGTSLKGRESAWRAARGFGLGRGLECESPKGVGNVARGGRNP